MAAHGTRAALRFRADVASIAKEIIAHRRHIHKVCCAPPPRDRILRAQPHSRCATCQHPEVAFTEVKTAGYIAQHCRSLGLAVREGVGRTGVVVDIDGDSGPGQCIGASALNARTAAPPAHRLDPWPAATQHSAPTWMRCPFRSAPGCRSPPRTLE